MAESDLDMIGHTPMPRLARVAAKAVLERFRLFTLAESPGGVESQAEHPASMTHTSIPAERLPAGIEDVGDVLVDVEQALRGYMNRVQFTTYLRGTLGRTYSVADEDHGLHGAVRLIVTTRRAEAALSVDTTDSWIRDLEPFVSNEDRVLLKHLSICIRRFFANPEYLPERSFAWPGTPRSRGSIRAALDPRKWRRESVKGQERQD